MPSRRPDKVITHRIELGRYERERLDNMMMAYNFNKISSPMVAGMSDVSFMLTLGALLTIMFPSIVIPWGAKTTAEVVEAVEKGIKAEYEKGKETAKRWYEREKEEVLHQEPLAVRAERGTSLMGGVLNVIDTAMAVLTGRMPTPTFQREEEGEIQPQDPYSGGT